MNKLLAILIALAAPCFLLAQSAIHKSYPTTNINSVSIEFQHGNVIIENYDGPEIIIEGTVSVNGKDGGDYFNFDSKKLNNELKIIANADFEDVDKTYTIIQRDGAKLLKMGNLKSLQNIDKDVSIESVNYGVHVEADFTIKVPKSLQLKVASTYGNVKVLDYWEDMKVKSTYGSVDVILNDPPPSPTLEVSSTYSTVDLTIPPSVNAELSMKTDFGEVYTDMDIQVKFNKSSKICNLGKDITTTLNKGIGAINLKAPYSNIYLRKPKKL